MLTEDEILRIYEDAGAVWRYDYRRGDLTLPHAELTSGLCADFYINSAEVMSRPQLCERLAQELLERLRKRDVLPVDWVIGSGYGAITFSYEVARQVGARHGFVLKDRADPKRMVWEGLSIFPGAVVLQCEEVIVTRLTTFEVRAAVTRGNPAPVIFHPIVATAIYRPPEPPHRGDMDVIALVTRVVKAWEPSDCPLCVQGSPRLRPKSHWQELTGGK